MQLADASSDTLPPYESKYWQQSRIILKFTYAQIEMFLMSLFYGSVDEDALLYSAFPSIGFIVQHSYSKKELDFRSPLRFSICRA